MGRALLLIVLLTVGCPSPRQTNPLSQPGDVGVTTADAATPDASSSADASSGTLLGPGFPEQGPWLSFYGTAAQMGDLVKVASTFRIINIDADGANFTDAQLTTLHAGGRNRVLSYLDLGSCERFRSYWSSAPAPLVPCSKGAQLGAYEGYPDEVWMDVGDPAYQALILDHVAARLAARGVDGFYLDNLEIVEHGPRERNGPCNTRCRQGGLDLVRKLRERFPQMLLVMQNATGEVTRTATTGGIAFPLLLDGVAHEEVYSPELDPGAETELLAWQAMGLRTPGGRPLWVGVEDYVGSCSARDKARAALARSAGRGFSGYASDESGGQKVVCYW